MKTWNPSLIHYYFFQYTGIGMFLANCRYVEDLFLQERFEGILILQKKIYKIQNYWRTIYLLRQTYTIYIHQCHLNLDMIFSLLKVMFYLFAWLMLSSGLVAQTYAISPLNLLRMFSNCIYVAFFQVLWFKRIWSNPWPVPWLTGLRTQISLNLSDFP